MTNTSRRGFAAMDAEKRRETASKGGRAAHLKGTAHQFAPEEAREAGRKGGQAVSKNREHMAAIGRKGRQSAAARSAAAQGTNGHTYPQQGTNGHTQPQPEATMRKDNMSQNAVEMLKADHAKVDTLFEQYDAASGQLQKQQTVVEQICKELDIHAKLEEEIFYPAVRSKGQGNEELVDEGVKEHGKIKEDIRTLRSLSPEDDEYDSTVQSLMECVQHHVGEEEGEMFPKVQEQFGEALNRLGAEMQQRKQQLQGASSQRTGFAPQESSMAK